MTHISEDSYPLSWSNLPFKLPLLPFHWNMLRKEEIEEFIRLSIEYERTKVRRDDPHHECAAEIARLNAELAASQQKFDRLCQATAAYLDASAAATDAWRASERTKVRRDTLEQCAQLLECGFMQSWADKFRDMKP